MTTPDPAELEVLARQMTAVRHALENVQQHVEVLTQAFRSIDWAELDRLTREDQ